MTSDRSSALRRWFLVIAVMSTAGTAIELAMVRHWDNSVQFVAWGALALLGVAIVLVARGRTRRTLLTARVSAVVVGLTSAFGVFEHVLANYDAGPLNARFSSTWATMSEPARLWAAFTKSVGPSPSLVPLVLAQAALCVVLSTLGVTRS